MVMKTLIKLPLIINGLVSSSHFSGVIFPVFSLLMWISNHSIHLQFISVNKYLNDMIRPHLHLFHLHLPLLRTDSPATPPCSSPPLHHSFAPHTLHVLHLFLLLSLLKLFCDDQEEARLKLLGHPPPSWAEGSKCCVTSPSGQVQQLH